MTLRAHEKCICPTKVLTSDLLSKLFEKITCALWIDQQFYMITMETQLLSFISEKGIISSCIYKMNVIPAQQIKWKNKDIYNVCSKDNNSKLKMQIKVKVKVKMYNLILYIS